MKMNSRQRAQQWPFPRHKSFVQCLRESSSAWFADKGFPQHLKMAYCLSDWSSWPSNIILKEVVEYVESRKIRAKNDGKPYPLHKSLHHGLSSQAMVFNLVGPLITRNDYSPLLSLLERKGVKLDATISSAEFEYEDREVFNEDTGQPTSMDVVLYDSNKRPMVFIESKLVEQEFGSCSVFDGGDCNGMNPIGQSNDCFLHFIGRRYWDLMDKYGISEILKNEKQCVFVAHYQFFREVLFTLEKNGIFVLLYDERSPVFHCSSVAKEKGLMPFLVNMLPPNLRTNIFSISVQDLVEAVKDFSIHHDWIFEFEKKYGMA